MSQPVPEAVEARPAWLSEAIVRLCKLPKELPPAPGVRDLAVQLVRSVEADDLPVPGCYVTNRGSIVLTWTFGDRELRLCVTHRLEIRVGRKHAGTLLPYAVINENRAEQLRRYAAWLYPAANTRFVSAWLLKGQ